ncbi:MAG: PLP-dependent aminotransferase family protein [Armatimonadetes bacterium]|nr:PLP-dependent aminotransferase family protein [Anaerolineae bacterium]
MLNVPNLTVPIDRDGEEPIYRQLIRYIKTQIDSGSLPAGTRLPASRDLAEQLAISRISVVNAYAELRAEGYLSAHAGRGTFVSKENGGAPTPMSEKSNGALPPAPSSNIPDRSLREMMRLARRPGVISFGPGAPPTEFLPVQYLRDAINTVLDRDGARALAYEEPEGYAPLRTAVRDYVSALGIQCNASDVLITGGTQQALDLVIQALLSEGETLVTEDPTYIGMIDIAQTRRVQLQGIPMDEDGIRLDILENYIIDHAPRLIYVMPSFQNPTGTVMPLHRRRQLLNLAYDYHIPILEDGVYHEFRFEGEPVLPLRALDEHGMVIHASGFSKMLLPGIRIGSVIAPVTHYTRLVRVKQAADISTPGLNQRAIHLMLQRGVMAQQLERNNREFKRRRDLAVDAAKRYFPAGAHWRVPLGGLYLWVTLPRNGPTAAELYITAIQKGVGYAIGGVYFTRNPDNFTLRLNFGAHKPIEIEEGFRRIGQAWEQLYQEYAHIEKSPLL